MTPLERAARALYERRPYEREGATIAWQHIADQSEYIEDARAVLQAIREPSEGMVEAALGYPLPKGLRPSSEAEIQALVEPGSCYHSWQSMIDRALEEG